MSEANQSSISNAYNPQTTGFKKLSIHCAPEDLKLAKEAVNKKIVDLTNQGHTVAKIKFTKSEHQSTIIVLFHSNGIPASPGITRV